ncbi:MAG TPA: Crp/Fnr family transcriptional regulator [Bacteroidales bacterium]|nr:Crp/Fnr family transcriptional regulator [Bacteroidales bacterium]HOL97223.1 Crp/Fnr family transcriptional regulator [Bacteroidales bacterium]HOM35515.1 Crp/Fnr family transcriptional regulator [Bacteroidales bacterium]HPD23864.1 Crp/Fnr family transcriptional regulator [Bacteroidales bacterium]HRS98788.1 Crp/Fnr family transcriptional regulator [Bacteroidales bacterium]
MIEESGCKSCALLFKNVFKKLSSEQFEYLDSVRNCIILKKGKVLYEEGNRITGIYCIKSGVVKIYKTGIEGKEQIIKFAKGGDIFGYRSVINNEPACTGVTALEDTLLCQIPSSDLFKLLRENADFALEMLHIACKELDQSNRFITDIAQKSVKERLAEILLHLKNEFGVNNEDMINLTLTREELANIIGTATESVIRLLSEFKTEGLIEIHGRKIKIKNESKLKKICNSY